MLPPSPPQSWSFVLAWRLDPLALRFARNHSRSSAPDPLAAHQHGINASLLLKTASWCGARWRFMCVAQKKLTSASEMLAESGVAVHRGITLRQLYLPGSNTRHFQTWKPPATYSPDPFRTSKFGSLWNKQWLETAAGTADRVLSDNWNFRGERGHNLPIRWARRSRILCVSTVFSNFPTGLGVCSLVQTRIDTSHETLTTFWRRWRAVLRLGRSER